MRDRDCARFLKWCLPRLGLRWHGFRKVRGTVCKRVTRRMRALGLGDVDAYRSYLQAHEEEWARLDAMCRIPVSRLWRDREVFDFLGKTVLPSLAARAAARGEAAVRAWSTGCASGEEVYSLRLAWSLRAGAERDALRLRIVATDADDVMLERARAGRYQRSSLREVPDELAGEAFERSGERYEIRAELRRDVAFRKQDIRREMPDGPFDLILCRNLAFTYFAEPAQRDLLAALCARLRPGGALVIGRGETLPEDGEGLAAWNGPASVYRLACA